MDDDCAPPPGVNSFENTLREVGLRGKDPIELSEGIKEKYGRISDYMSKNKLVLNSDKTHLLIMTSARNHKSHGNYGITLDTGTEIIEPGNEEKLLGGHMRRFPEPQHFFAAK